MLWGLEAFQVAWYYIHYGNDPLSVKSWVALLFLTGTTHEILLFVGVYRYLVRHFGDIDFISHQEAHMVCGTLLTSLASLLAQTFYAFRIYQFAERKSVKYGIPAILMPLILWEMGGGIYYVVKALQLPFIADLARLVNIGTSFTGASAAADVIIAATMSVLLYKRRTGVKKTDQMLTYLTIASINTGFWTAVLTLMTIIIAPATPTSDLYYLIPYLALPSVYINSVLCNLNIRQPLRRLHEDGPCISLPVLTNVAVADSGSNESGAGKMKFSERKGVKQSSTFGSGFTESSWPSSEPTQKEGERTLSPRTSSASSNFFDVDLRGECPPDQTTLSSSQGAEEHV